MGGRSRKEVIKYSEGEFLYRLGIQLIKINVRAFSDYYYRHYCTHLGNYSFFGTLFFILMM